MAEIDYIRDEYNYNNSYHIERTPLSDAFFADENVEVLRDALRKSVYLYIERETGLKIDIGADTQEKKELISVMKSILHYYRQHMEDNGDLKSRIKFLDKECIDHLTPKIAGKAISYLRYLRDIDRPYNLIDVPIDTKLTKRTIQLNSYYNDCGN